MHCTGMKQFLPDLASGVQSVSEETEQHLRQCPSCAAELATLRSTMALLDHWEAPDPSPYFETRLFARVREEKAKAAPRAWLNWVRKPALALALTLLVVTGVSLYNSQRGLNNSTAVIAADPGTPVGDLNALDKNHDLLTDFDVLDDLQVQHDVTP
jgi:predicted anti-sigma-YlaC factor YlaD